MGGGAEPQKSRKFTKEINRRIKYEPLRSRGENTLGLGFGLS